MILFNENLRRFKSEFDRFKLFAILLLLQFVIITLFQSRLSIRNYNLNVPLNAITDFCPSYNFMFHHDYFNYFAVENYLFIAYQTFLMYLGLNAIFSQHVMQICAYTLMNVGGYVYLIIQMIEVKSTIGYVKRECLIPEITQGNEALEEIRLDPKSINPKILENELPQFIVYTLFLILTGYLSLTMYSQFGFNYYFRKKVGNSELFISLLKKRFKLLLLLKFFVFFSIVYFVLSIYFLLRNFFLKDYYKSTTCLIALLFFIFALRLARVTFISVDNEFNDGMLFFSYLWIFVIFNNIMLCFVGIYFIRNSRWYFLFPYNLVYLGVSLASYKYALQVQKDFGKGLKEAIESNKIELEQQ